MEALSDQNSPDWLGLPNNAERVLLASAAHDLVINLLKIQQLDEDEELAYSDGEVKGDAVEGRPAWMRAMEAHSSAWLAGLPNTLQPLRRTVENIKDPLYRFFEREVNFGLKLLQSVRLDLEDVAAITSGSKKQTNHHRALIQQLNKGMIPASWLCYKVPSSCSVAAWMADFAQRVKQLTKVSQAVSGSSAASLKTATVWMGGLFNLEAFVTATRQCVAQANSWSLEELSLDVTVADETNQPSFDHCSFAVEGIKLSGAVCRGNMLAISSEFSTPPTGVSKLLLIRSGIEVNPGPAFEMKKIQDAAEKIWNHAGQVVDIQAAQNYTYEGSSELDPSVTALLEDILKDDLGVSFQLKDYQNVTIQAMAKFKDVIVISPPGSGKSLATYAGASLLRKLHNKPAGVVLHLVPYNSIILDKVKNPWLPTGFVMMGGKTGTEEVGIDDGDVESNFNLQDLEEGKLSVLVCHPESLLSQQGEEILKCLLRSNLLLAVMVDEFHKVLFWGCSEAELTGRQKDEFSVAFRPGMKKVVRKLKSLASKVPFVFETATILPNEIDLAKKTFNVKSPVIIRSSPVQQQHCYFNLRRPDQGVPWEGDEDEAGTHIPGLKDVLMELVVKPYVQMVKSEKSGSQKIMLFSKSRATLDKIDQELCVLLPDQSRLLPDQSPW